MNEPHKPTDEQRRTVQAMAGFGIPQDDIARVIGVDPKTIRLHYREELDKGVTIANTAVAQNLFQKATGKGRESVTAGIFWLKCRAGWSEYAPAPPPRPTKDEPLGKKEQAALEAETAGDDNEWGGLVH